MDESDDIRQYIDSLQPGKSLDEKEIRQGYEKFKGHKLIHLEDGATQGEINDIKKLNFLYLPVSTYKQPCSHDEDLVWAVQEMKKYWFNS